MILMDSSWSGSPHPPNIIAPRQSGLTCIPVRPRLRYSMSGLCPRSGHLTERSATSRFRNSDYLLVNTRIDETALVERSLRRRSPRREHVGLSPDQTPAGDGEALSAALLQEIPMSQALRRRRRLPLSATLGAVLILLVAGYLAVSTLTAHAADTLLSQGKTATASSAE